MARQGEAQSSIVVNQDVSSSAYSRPTRKRKQLDNNDDQDEDHDYPVDTLATSIKKQKASEVESSEPNVQAQSTNTIKCSPRKGGKNVGAVGLEVAQEEKRLKRFRPTSIQKYAEVKHRALTQRLTVMGRERMGTEEIPEERVTIAGSTGNLYTVSIARILSCDCPHASKGNQCKHIIYVMLHILKAPENLSWQAALLSSELRSIFAEAPPIPTADADADSSDGNRKPIENACPICYYDFEPKSEAIVYCKAACGNNVHKDCMSSWTAACKGRPTCPYCRAAWAMDEVVGGVNLKDATIGEDGYVNVASRLGLSGERDYSTYHQPWVRQQFRGRRKYR
ncbi:hypothetical protein BU24DRAFT_464489 [Aaosphaeria arxii CBS 175.79]|uniref:Uncharacterized protein n=1 Tax=Aaosphaeria arxii CBS 175.79 TaxID=1450172 RepID=A0A6A5XLP2_9PLEO|nr:uncharacterized protein BU24DRAFT_464489 [Aaosphaeria arxii CBS 175.79]KAF2013737.1 hypothetical protein BU24DRAFT_464489 [Aaosphaeria arxii CBS 175.79]